MIDQAEKEKHLQIVYKNNVVVSMDGDKLIVVHSKRSVKPLIPFVVSKQVLEQWMQRDNRVGITDKSYIELLGIRFHESNKQLVCVSDFNEIEFSEE